MTTLDFFRYNVKWFMLAMAIVFIAGIFIGPGFGSYGHINCGNSELEKKKTEDKVIAKMGDKEFKQSEIYYRYEQEIGRRRSFNPSAMLTPETPLQIQWYILDNMINSELKLKKAAEENIQVEEKELNQKYEEQKKSIMDSMGLLLVDDASDKSIAQLAGRGIYSQKAEKAYQGFLAERGLSVDKLRQSIKDDLLIQKYDEKLNDIALEEVKKEAKDKADKLVKTVNPDGSNMEELTKDKENTSTAYQLVKDFTRQSAKQKGDEFATRLFTSNLNQVLEPIEVDNSYYILFIESRIIAEGEEYQKAKDGIIAEIKKELDQNKKDDSLTEIKQIEEEQFQEMAQTEGLEDPAKKTDEKPKEVEITEDMIKERYEKVTYKQIQVRPESTYTRVDAKIKEFRESAGVEIVDPMLKAYSYIASYTPEEKNFDAALDSFRIIRETRKKDLADSEIKYKEADEKVNSAGEEEDNTQLLNEFASADQTYTYNKDQLALIDYLISQTMLQQIDSINTKRQQTFAEKNPTPDPTQQPPGPTPEEQEMFDRFKTEMFDLMQEAVSLQDTPVPHYSALLGDLYLEKKDWVKTYENYSKVVEYANLDMTLLRKADSAYNQILDELESIDPKLREEAGKSYDKLQTDLAAGQKIEDEQRQKQQEMMQQMIQEQMAKQTEKKEADKSGDETTGNEEGK
jgi:hypothetical protein